MDALKIDERLDRIERLLLCNKKVFTFDEVCEYTGFSRSYIYKLTASGNIPHSKPNGKVLFFEKNKIDQWLLENAIQTNAEIASKANQHILKKKR